MQATNTNFVGLSFTLLMGLLLILLPRRLAPFPLFLSACFMTTGQRIDVGGLNFYMLRIIILCGWARLISRKELFCIKINAIDKTIIWWVICSIIAYTLQRNSFDAFINRLGFAYNAIGLYFLFRCLILDFEDVERSIKSLAVVVIALAGLILIEYATQRNFFSIFGGVPELTEIRGGRLRCQGPFAHPILAGTFGSIFIPFAVALWVKGKDSKLLGLGGFFAGTAIMICSGSSGPVMTYMIGILGLAMWHLRGHMRVVVWVALFALITLILYMQAPVWFLSAKLSRYIGGGTGWHRSELIHQAIKHFDEWWFLGTSYTAHWMPYALEINPDMADITNQYVSEGVNGGIGKLILFVSIIILCFKQLGRALRSNENWPFGVKITLWAMGATLLGHVTAFMAVAYFDQMIVFWYLLLALISCTSGLSEVTLHDSMNTTRVLEKT